MRLISTVLIAVFLVFSTGCASHRVSINGVPVNDQLYADSGQTATDAGSQGAEKKWYQKPFGVATLVVVAGLLGWWIYEVVDDDEYKAPEPATCGCFGADTAILMADGSYKKITEMEIGDKVLAYDFDAEKPVAAEVTKTHAVTRSQSFNMNGLTVSAEQPFFYRPDAEQTALLVGDTDRNPSTLEGIEMDNIKRINKPTQVFNITVDRVHNYFVSDGDGKAYLVHNKSVGPCGPVN